MTETEHEHSLYWQPRRAAALIALRQFVPRAGGAYVRERNFDYGPRKRDHVSRLSPWVRVRAISEPEIIRAVCAAHAPTSAEKFIQEVCWRTYWKGWLELRPSVWTDYVQAVRAAKAYWADHPGYVAAINGRTDSPAFNVFLRELLETGYLHNHARMWFASIWIFTLRLPWSLGADLFLRHLLDGDAAVNTLSWRWVAGLQTRGKHYVARADNIAKYTGGRLGEGEALLESPQPMTEEAAMPAPVSLTPLGDCPVAGKAGLIISEDDMSAGRWLPERHQPTAVAGIFPLWAYQEAGAAAPVIAFRQALLKEAVGDGEVWDNRAALAAAVRDWVEGNALDCVIMAEPPVGFGQCVIEPLADILRDLSIPFCRERHPWDDALFPHATHGFFRFRKRLPKIIQPWL